MGWWPQFFSIFVLVASVSVAIRAMAWPHREPASRIAWVVVIIVVPILGVIAYLLLGEARISPARRSRAQATETALPRPPGDPAALAAIAGSPHAAAFALARTVNQLDPTGGNRARLANDNAAAIREMIADIDAATREVHVCFYIWLEDESGLAVKDALIRAASRGVAVRALADALGSRAFVRSRHWRALRQAGCDARVALPVGNLLWTMLRGRVDLRNHRKILICDNRVVWCGSQNCADSAFRIKPRFAPWIDVMVRLEGPVARQSQFLFAADWMAEGGDDIASLLREDVPQAGGSTLAQVLGTGPTTGFNAMSACFAELIHSARRELIVTTPYFVPDEQLLFAITGAARRGIQTTLILPARNDSRIVAAASRGHYGLLLEAGVRLYAFMPGLLHAKTMVVDGRVALVGSANLDRRSFELNFENNVLIADPVLAGSLRARQMAFLDQSVEVHRDDVARDGLAKRVWQNLLGTLSPIL